MIINSANLNKLRTGFKSLYDAAFSGFTPSWTKIAMVVTSTTSEMKYGWLGNTTRFREWLGDRVVQNLKNFDFTIKNKDFENTVAVDRNSIMDDEIGQYGPLFSMMGYDAATHPDELVFKLLQAGFNTLCYDGQYFIDTDHPVVDADGVTQSVSNSGGGAGNPWFLLDVSKPIKPIIYQKRSDYKFVALDNADDPNVFHKKEYLYGVDGRCNVGYGLWQLAFGSKQTLDATNYKAARAAMSSVKGDNGRPLNVTPNLLVVGPSNEAAALELTKSERNAAGATNVFRGTAEVLVVSWLP